MSAPPSSDPTPDRAVIPAAGLGTRLRPLSAAIPKEMLPLGRKPVLEYVVEEMRAAGLTRLLLVISPDKEMIRHYLGDGSRWGVRCDYTIQREMRGLGDAVLHAESWTEGRPFVVAFGDCIIESRGERREATGDSIGERCAQHSALSTQHASLTPEKPVGSRQKAATRSVAVEGRGTSTLTADCRPPTADSPLARLIGTHVRQDSKATVLTERIARKDTRKYGILAPAAHIQDAPQDPFPLAGIIEKPAPDTAPSLQAVAGRWVLGAAIFDYIRQVGPGPNGEVGLSEAVRALIERGASAWAVPLRDGEARIDIGGWDTYLVAAATAAARDAEWGDRVRAAVCRKKDAE